MRGKDPLNSHFLTRHKKKVESIRRMYDGIRARSVWLGSDQIRGENPAFIFNETPQAFSVPPTSLVTEVEPGSTFQSPPVACLRDVKPTRKKKKSKSETRGESCSVNYVRPPHHATAAAVPSLVWMHSVSTLHHPLTSCSANNKMYVWGKLFRERKGWGVGELYPHVLHRQQTTFIVFLLLV